MAGLTFTREKYYARIYYKDNGKQREKKINLKTANKEKALELKESIDQQEKLFKQGTINLDEIKVKEPTDLERMIEEHRRYLKVSGKADTTITLYKQALEAFNDIYHDQDIELLSRQDYTQFLAKMKERYPCNTTCNIRLRSIRSFLNWLVETGRIKEVPFKITKLPVKQKKPRYFSDKEMGMILEEATPNRELYARIFVHWKTGIRLSEIHNSYIENGFLKTYDPIKKGQERSIPVDSEIKKQYSIAENGDYTDNTISRKFRKILKKLGQYYTKHGDKRSFHNLRHTFAVRKFCKTGNIYEVKVLLGHSSVKTTEKYAQFSMEELENDFDIRD